MIGDLCHLYFNEMNCDDLGFFFSFIYVFCIHCTYRMNVYYQKFAKYRNIQYFSLISKVLSLLLFFSMNVIFVFFLTMDDRLRGR